MSCDFCKRIKLRYQKTKKRNLQRILKTLIIMQRLQCLQIKNLSAAQLLQLRKLRFALINCALPISVR